MQNDTSSYEKQGFGADLALPPPYGLLIVDFVNGFADPEVFGGGNIAEAIEKTVSVLAHARQHQWPVAHTRIVFADGDADSNIFTEKVPGLLTLKEADHNSAIVPQLAPRDNELVVRKTVPSAFFGTSLAAWLTQRGVKTLLIAGSTTSGCVRSSVHAARCRHGGGGEKRRVKRRMQRPIERRAKRRIKRPIQRPIQRAKKRQVKR